MDISASPAELFLTVVFVPLDLEACQCTTITKVLHDEQALDAHCY